jgi:hypothetical protein
MMQQTTNGLRKLDLNSKNTYFKAILIINIDGNGLIANPLFN